ncbi:unnamed protein product [Thlaspi arvense]|uniref:Reverse transcriptase zinc-binding domain-containing protein n=1 Tax=Thlaspi arvense TaxID=13288 RepID=A0AAU9RZC1_THLAR|nr:unnamed protein product [Thlaspi arvense]
MGLAMVADAFSSCDWQCLNRSTNVNVSILGGTLQALQAPSPSRRQDGFLWGSEGSTSPLFSTKITWNLIRARAEVEDWVKAVWFKGMVPKHTFNFWTPVKGEACSLGSQHSTRYVISVLCKMKTESTCSYTANSPLKYGLYF